jgi:hypothetical protein
MDVEEFELISGYGDHSYGFGDGPGDSDGNGVSYCDNYGYGEGNDYPNGINSYYNWCRLF